MWSTNAHCQPLQGYIGFAQNGAYCCKGGPYLGVTDKGACDRAWTECASQMKSKYTSICAKQVLNTKWAQDIRFSNTKQMQDVLIKLLSPVQNAIYHLRNELAVANVSLGATDSGAKSADSILFLSLFLFIGRSDPTAGCLSAPPRRRYRAFI